MFEICMYKYYWAHTTKIHSNRWPLLA